MTAIPLLSAPLGELEEDHELSMEFETPHTDWAQPYALGKVRLLYFCGADFDDSFEPRNIIELMQRFDIEAEAAYHHRPIGTSQLEWRGAEAGIARILKLLEQPWDCFVFHGLPITQLPAEAQDKVLKAVTEGAGIVLIGVDDERVLKSHNKVTDLPVFLAHEPVGEVYQVNVGRAMRLPERPQIAYRPGWEVDYDYWVERVGRAVLWAANKSPRVDLTIAPDAAQIDRAELLDNAIKVQWEGEHGPGALRLEVRLRRSDGMVFDLHPASQDPTTYRFERRYRAGQYHIDTIAHSEDGVEAWATTPLEITASRLVGAIELDKNWGELDETISGTVKLSGAPLVGETVRVQLIDVRQRILVQADRPVTDAAASFEFAIEDWMPMLLEVRALVMDGEEEVSSKYAYFHVTKRNRGQFNFVVWEVNSRYSNDTLAPYAEQQLARLGCTVALRDDNSPSLALAANDIAVIPYTTRISDPYGGLCWNNEPAIDESIDRIVSQWEPSRQHGVFGYSLGDEIVTKGACVHPACLAAYRRYLQQQYGNITALNESWGSDYASFEQVNVLVEGNDEEAALDAAADRPAGVPIWETLEPELYPRWYDRQAFKGYNFVKLYERYAKRFKEMDPQAITGFEGAGGLTGGNDVDLISRTIGFWAPYPGMTDEVIRSIADRDFIRSNWMGYTKGAESLLGKYWRMVTRGTDSVWWWRWNGFGRYRGLLAPHLAPWRAIKEMQRDTQIVRDGLGSLLLKCRREDDGIAILHSYPSAFASLIDAGPSYSAIAGASYLGPSYLRAYEKAHRAWTTIPGKYSSSVHGHNGMLRALGLQFNYVTDRMLRRGEFRAGRYKVLILPQTEAIGPREAEVIRAFVENGGTVIADVRPGIYDGHCKPLAHGILDDLFGIERTGNQEALTRQAEIDGILGNQPVAVSFSARVDPTVRVTTEQPRGSAEGTPLCIVNQVGQGRAVLLNFTMDSLPRISAPQEPPDAADDFMAALLALAGVEPEVTVTDLAGNPVRDTEVIRWNGRGVDFLTLFGGKDEIVQVHLPYRQHVYDLRQHAYRGRRASFTVHKMPNRATFLALTGRQLSGPQIRLSPTPIARGEQLILELSYPETRAYHAARLRVYQPDGGHAEWLDQVVIVGLEGARVTLPIAYNDPSGLWTIHAIDLYTDELVATRVNVE